MRVNPVVKTEITLLGAQINQGAGLPLNREQRRAIKRKRPSQQGPRLRDLLACNNVFKRLEPFTEAELLKLNLPIRMSFEALKKGEGTAQDFHDLDAVVCTCVIRGREVSPECEQVALAAYEALRRVRERWMATSKWGFDGPALMDVGDCIELHEQLVALSTPLELANALKQVIRNDAQEVES